VARKKRSAKENIMKLLVNAMMIFRPRESSGVLRHLVHMLHTAQHKDAYTVI